MNKKEAELIKQYLKDMETTILLCKKIIKESLEE